jgi:hypothetical protein
MRKAYGLHVFVILILTAAAFSSVPQGSQAKPKVTISGRVTNFDGQPIGGAQIMLKDDGFHDVATAASEKDGHYSLQAPKGRYMALAAVKDYQTKNLEYWAWNVPADRDLEINPRFHRIEVYAINAWRPQGAYPSYQIYFRPMSLTKVIKKVMEAGGMDKLQELPVIDIAPELETKDIKVSINDRSVAVLAVSRVREAAGPQQFMFGYLIQVALPEETSETEYSVITITLTDPATGDMGEGSLFIRL